MKRFAENFGLQQVVSTFQVSHTSAHQVKELLGGITLPKGLLRFLNSDESADINVCVARAFPDLPQDIDFFAIDWLSRAYGVSSSLNHSSTPKTFMCDIGAGEWFDLPVGLDEFLDVEVVDHDDELFSKTFYDEWARINGHRLNEGQSLGYKIPLFLSGKDEVENLEVVELSVYWHIFSQLAEQVRGLKPGDTISGIKISD